MKYRIFLLFCLSVIYHFNLRAQKFPVSIGPSLNIAVGEFTTTHAAGFGIECSGAWHWFEFSKGKKLNFNWTGGLSYYFGKKVTTSGFSNKYPGYIFIHAFPGLQFNPIKKMAIRFHAGPGLGIYNGSSRFQLGSELDATYLIKRNLAVGPSLILMKESGADGLWAVALKARIKL